VRGRAAVEDVLARCRSHTTALNSTYTAGQVVVLRLAIAIVSTSLICHVDRRNAGKTRAEVSVDGQWRIAREMRWQEKCVMTKNVA
jgi:hypothetical protein